MTGRKQHRPSLAELEHAQAVIADVMRFHPNGRAALPIFERLERERAEALQEAQLYERAMKLSANA